MSKKIPIAIVGATGYTGVELVRLLLNHPRIEIRALTSRQNAGVLYSKIYPSFSGKCNLVCEPLNISKIAKRVKAVFLCLPHHQAMDTAKRFRNQGIKVLDLSADFRITDPQVYEEWYGKHSQKKLLKEAVYGLPELHRKKITGAKLVAVPGCYPTSNILGLAPLFANKMISLESIICDSKSGVSGAGAALKQESQFCEVNDNFKAYKVGVHRHAPEIEQESSLISGEKISVMFTPHLVPMDRGILSTIYCQPIRRWSTDQLLDIFRKFYRKDRFVKVLPKGSLASTKPVRGTNYCHLSPLYDKRTETIVVLSAIDNLTKGASGQAIQCFNLMYGMPETTGLLQTGFIP